MKKEKLICAIRDLLQALSVPKEIVIEEAIASRLESLGKEGNSPLISSELSLPKTCRLIASINKSIMKHDTKINRLFSGKQKRNGKP